MKNRGGVEWKAYKKSLLTQIAAKDEQCNDQVVKSKKDTERLRLLPRRLFVASLSAPATSMVARQKPAVTRRMAPSSTNRQTSNPCRVPGTLILRF